MPRQNGKHPAMRPSSLRFSTRTKRLSLVLVILLSAAAGPASARSRTPTGTHIPQIEHPFVMSNAMWNTLFAGTAPSGRRLSAQQLSPLVLHSEWPANTVSTRATWHLKVGVFLLNVRSDGTVASVEVLQRIGHPNMDGDTVRSFAKWRFRPNSVREVRVPSYYTRIN